MITLTTEQAQQIEEALSELMDLMDGVREGDYKPDSFTNQPAEEALATIRAARAQEQAEQEPVVKYYGEKLVKGSKVFALLDRDLAPDTLLYAAPVRTKDLTNSEKLYILGSHINPITKDVMGLSLIDAVIAADREKNK